MADEDSELLRRYASTRCQQAFALLVRRYVDHVYSAALRQVRGDHHRAEDVTQAVFIVLAKKANRLGERVVRAALTPKPPEKRKAPGQMTGGFFFTFSRFHIFDSRRVRRRLRH